jgi:hypothetical protein
MHIFSGPVEAGAVSTGWLFWNPLAHPLLGEGEEGESPANTRRSRPSLNDYPFLCDTLNTAEGAGGLYQRQ